MADTDIKEYVDLKLETAQAHNNAQFEIVLQRLDSMQESMRSLRESMPTKWTVFATAASTVVAVSGIFIAVLAFGGDRFDSGLSAASLSVRDAIEAREIATRNADEMRSIQADLDTILNLLDEQARQR